MSQKIYKTNEYMYDQLPEGHSILCKFSRSQCGFRSYIKDKQTKIGKQQGLRYRMSTS